LVLLEIAKMMIMISAALLLDANNAHED
jgi:hypothetical protein